MTVLNVEIEQYFASRPSLIDQAHTLIRQLHELSGAMTKSELHCVAHPLTQVTNHVVHAAGGPGWGGHS